MTTFAVWNNKGGVGKSTITFHIATRFAQLNPDKKVLVIDLCPQANASMMLLGGGSKGESTVLSFCTESTPRTVVGYLSNVIAGGQRAPLPDPNDFVVSVNSYNGKLANNLFLLSGDGNLEPMAPAISNAANAPQLTPTSHPWRWIHEIFKSLISDLKSKDEWVVFVDTNPSFSIYTELAVSTADKLIVPVNADDSSRVATNAMFILLYGATPPHPIYGSWTYANRANISGLSIPQVHLIVGNRLTQYSGAAAAFSALSEATADTLYSNYRIHPTYFTDRGSSITNLKTFREEFSVPLRDFNTVGVVSAHMGAQMSEMKQGYYPVHGSSVKCNADQILEATNAIDEILGRL